MLRWLWRRIEDAAMLVFLFIVASGCASKRDSPAPVVPDVVQAGLPVDTVINHVIVDSAAAEWFAAYRLLLPVENTVCLYGVIRADTAYVMFMKATRTFNASPALVYYDPCPLPKRDLFGDLLWLGGWHNHGPVFPGVDCAFSVMDDRSFFEQRAFIDIVSCSQGLWARGRKK